MSETTFSRRRTSVRPARSFRTSLRVELLEGRDLLSASPSFAPGELLIGLTQTDVADFYVDHGLSELKNLDMGDRILRLVTTPKEKQILGPIRRGD